MNQDLLASFCTSNGTELSRRVPCRRLPDGLYMESCGKVSDGIADVVMIWCADCGGFVEQRMLPSFVVFEHGRMSFIRRPILPMKSDDWGRA